MSEQFDLIKYLSDSVDSLLDYMKKKSPDRLWMFEVQKSQWGDIYNAHKDGKKLIYVSACVPPELIFAFDCVPCLLDAIPTRLASQPELSSKYIDFAEQFVPPTMCAIDKVDVGTVFSGDMVEKPDAFIYTTYPCDNSRAIYPAIEKKLGVPTFVIDAPFRKDDRGYRYLADQYKDMVVFLEELTGKKLDWDRFEEVMDISNQTNILMDKVSTLRKRVPCPLPSRLLILNELQLQMIGHPGLLKFFENQYKVGMSNIENGIGAVPDEKYRVTWLQNMLWSNAGIMDWMEKKYGAVLIMDAFGYQKAPLFEDPKDRERVFMDCGRKALASPMIHGASGPAEIYLDLVDQVMDEYSINVAMFVGHVGCKHTWAAAKMVKDTIAEKYDLPTLLMDIDACDARYKSTEEIKEIISEYMESVVGAKPLQ